VILMALLSNVQDAGLRIFCEEILRVHLSTDSDDKSGW
jgi:hypothetical protein